MTIAGGASAEGGGEASSADEAKVFDSSIIAVVNDEALYSEDVGSVLGEIHSGAAEQSRTGFDLDQMLFRLVNDTLLAQEARALGMHEEASIRQRVAALRERVARARLEKEEITSRLRLDPEALERVYEEVFRTATLRIVTRKDRAEAEALREEIEAGADLEQLAREKSEDPYALRGGLMEDVPRIDLPRELGDLVFTMRPGEVGGPVANTVGWTVFRLESVAEADPGRFGQRKKDVREVLAFRQREALRAALLERLRADHQVSIDEEIYAAIDVSALPDGRLVPTIDDPDAVVVEAGGREVTAAAFGQALAARWSNLVNTELALAMKPLVLDRLTVEELMVAEALRRGYDQSPEADRAAHATDTRLLVDRYLREVISPRAEVTREEAEAYFESNRELYRRPPRLYLQQLTVDSQEEAERLAAEIRAGSDFAWLAKRFSQDQYREAGGALGWVPATRPIAGLQRELQAAKVGDLLGPASAGSAWVLVYVGAIEDGAPYTFAEVSGNVRSKLEEAKFLQTIDQHIRTLRERSDIWINEEAVAALRIEAEPGESDGPAAPGHGQR